MQQERQKGKRQLQNRQKAIKKMVPVSPYVSIITVHVSGLNFLNQKAKSILMGKKRKTKQQNQT